MKSGLSYSKSEFNQVINMLDKAVERVEKMVEFELKFAVGPMAVTHAKENGSFTDQTGNLRSSIGYVLAKDGHIIEEGGFSAVQGYGENTAIVRFKTKSGKEVSFHAKGKSGDGVQGLEEGKRYAEELGQSSGSGYTLIIVAGMNYAEYVETKGYNVLTATESYLESQVNEVIDRILKQAGFRR